MSACIDDLPAQRPVSARVIAAAGDEETDAASLGATVSLDPALTARLLTLANSAWYGLSGRVSRPAFAVSVVGFSTVRSLAVGAMVELDDPVLDVLGGFWERSVLTAVAAGHVAEQVGARANDAFSLGLLARLGQVLLLRCDPEHYSALLLEARDRGEVLTAETLHYGADHLRVGAEALAAWAFPAEFPEALHAVERHGWASTLTVAVRLGLEIAERIGDPERVPVPLEALSSGRLGEPDLEILRPGIVATAADLSRLLAG
ncbi:HDOD domain-containing protein [Kineococcus gynurae]|uniref:HDOD domain-containing protein n=1 Tax=Kineococcus gynurae TaxID=452979 RepID=A0ABV5LV11_9ACTN